MLSCNSYAASSKFSHEASYLASLPGIAIQSSNFSSNMDGISSESDPPADAATATTASSSPIFY